MEKTQGCRVPLEAKPVEVMIAGKANDKMLKGPWVMGWTEGGKNVLCIFANASRVYWTIAAAAVVVLAVELNWYHT